MSWRRPQGDLAGASLPPAPGERRLPFSPPSEARALLAPKGKLVLRVRILARAFPRLVKQLREALEEAEKGKPQGLMVEEYPR